MKVVLLNIELEEAYENYLLKSENTLFYSSNKFRQLLKRILNADDKYLIATDSNSNIIGVSPAFLINTDSGSVINSLPFYGSNGGIINIANDIEVSKILLANFSDLCKGCVSSTIVTSPFETNLKLYEDYNRYSYKNNRIGQITNLPDCTDDIMGMIHSKTRNMVRKANKNQIKVSEHLDSDILDFLKVEHNKNMIEIGGMPKPSKFFDLLSEIFSYEKEYKIYTALIDNQPVAALLLFYFNKTVEYYTPVIVKEYRTYQPLSLILYEAMKDAVKRGYRWWNWGGTPISLTGVYHFKKRWGAKDMQYLTYTVLNDKDVLLRSKEEVLRDYPYFFVVPFEELKLEKK